MKHAIDLLEENARLHRQVTAAKEVSWCWDLLIAAIVATAVIAAKNGW